jgi:hypothetical protein
MVQDQMTVENVDWAGGAFGGRICDSSVIEREAAAACNYLDLDALHRIRRMRTEEVGFPIGQLQTLSHGVRS